MIYNRLLGGLGNQLFQHACAIGLGKKWNIDYCAPSESINPGVWPSYKLPGLSYCKEGSVTAVFYKEPTHAFHEIPFHQNIILEGYWQSYKRFDFCREEVMKAFGFDDLDCNYGTVGLQIRRGDYLKFPLHHPVVTIDYIRMAAEKIKGDYEFLVFTDDVEWAKENINEELLGGRYFEIVEKGDALNDMKYLAMCEKHIVSNSTYGWWGAWLSNSTNKQVVSPHEDNWFGSMNKHLSVSDLLLPEWERIKF